MSLWRRVAMKLLAPGAGVAALVVALVALLAAGTEAPPPAGPSVCGVLRYETVTATYTETATVTETVVYTKTAVAAGTRTAAPGPGGSRRGEAAYLLSQIPAPPWPLVPKVAILEPSLAGNATGWLRGRGGLVLGYVNAGYAEEWRSYWPSLRGSGIVHGPAGYEGEYLVEYWSPEWEEALRGEIERAIFQGFQGVYLDNIDAYLVVEKQPWAAGRDAAEEMTRLVCWAKSLVSSLTGGSAVVYVNIGSGYELLYSGSMLRCIDGILREEVWTTWPGDEWSPTEALEVLDALSHAHAAGKTVIVVDPVDEGGAGLLCRRAWDRGWLPVPQPSWDPDYSLLPLPCSAGGDEK